MKSILALVMTLTLATPAALAEHYDLVLSRGLVMDPESGLSALRDVAIRDGRIVAISPTRLTAERTIDAQGRVIAPGFIDLHSHAHNYQIGGRVQAFDGVTTAIEAEMGQLPIAMAYAKAGREGRSINYGFTASWMQARMVVLARMPQDGTGDGVFPALRTPGWATDVATAEQAAQIRALMEQAIDEGAVGIGFMLGYTPGTTRADAHELSLLAARRKLPIFVHTRSTVSEEEGVQEVLHEAVSTGAAWHICHAPFDDRPKLQAKLEAARKAGATVTAEMLTSVRSGATFISAEFLRPQSMLKRGRPANSIIYYGKPVESYQELARLQKEDPGAFILAVAGPDDEEDPSVRKLVAEAIKLPDWTIATDAMPWTDYKGRTLQAGTWPLPEDGWAHPRSAATYTRLIEKYVVEWQLVDLMDVLRAGSLNPARVLERAVPQMRNKGRIKVGADADMIVFDPKRIRTAATMRKPAALSTGIDYVIVNGQVLVENNQLNTGIFPGQPVRRTTTAPASAHE